MSQKTDENGIEWVEIAHGGPRMSQGLEAAVCFGPNGCIVPPYRKPQSNDDFQNRIALSEALVREQLRQAT